MSPNVMETYIKTLVCEEIEKKGIELKENEAKKIVEAIIPVIDDLISKKVKSHFLELSNFIKGKYEEN